VITRVDERLRAEARAFRLVFTCEACHAFDRETGACAYGYPNDQHRNIELDRAAEVAFCKAFEVA
jgi:hypothetical protein